MGKKLRYTYPSKVKNGNNKIKATKLNNECKLGTTNINCKSTQIGTPPKTKNYKGALPCKYVMEKLAHHLDEPV